MKTEKKKIRTGNPRYHCREVLEFIRHEIVGMFEFHKSCPVGRCRRSGTCQRPRIRRPRSLDVENFDTYHAGLPLCVAAIGYDQRVELIRLMHSGNYEPGPGWTLAKFYRKRRRQKHRLRRQKRLHSEVAGAASSR